MFFINPFIYGGAGGDFESIATVTVGSGGASSIEFASIGTDWQHLQIRYLLRGTSTGTTLNVRVRLNGDTSANYARHLLLGNGSSASAFGSSDPITYQYAAGSSASSSVFGAGVLDFLDYASTSKTTTVRAVSGVDNNGSGFIALGSGLWTSTAAVTSIKLEPEANNWAQYSTAALYGVKAP